MSTEKRKRLMELAHKHKFLVVADEAYQLLNFEGMEKVLPMYYFDDMSDPRCISVGTFSKLM